MRVYFINTVCGKGSTGTIVADLCRVLKANGHAARVAYGRWTHPNDIDALKIETTAGMYRHALLARLTDRAGFFSRKATKRLIRDIRIFQPDIIHLHNLHGYYVNVEMLFRFLAEQKAPVAWTLHDCWPFTGHCTHYTFAGCDRYRTGCYDCPQRQRYPSAWRDNSFENHKRKQTLFSSVRTMRIITVSNWLKDQATSSFLSRYPVECIYNGVDLNTFRPINSTWKKRNGLESTTLILSVSDGWDERKGLSDILALARETVGQYTFVVVGLSKGQRTGLPTNVIGLERIWNRQELVELYSTADVFLNTSVEETFSLVTAEAIACGTPAVVYSATACPEILDDQSGIVLPFDSSLQDIQNALNKAKYFKGARKRAWTFALEHNLREYLDLYEQMCQGHQR